MVPITKLLSVTGRVMAKHSTSILTVCSTVGVAATGYLGYKAGKKATEKIIAKTNEKGEELTKKEKAKEIAKSVAPAAIVGGLTIGMIISSNIINIRRQRALSSALALSSEALATYKDKVVETLGEKKEAEMRGEIARDEVARDDPKEEIIFSTNEGDTLFKDRISGRYFRSDIDFIRKQQVKINRWLAAGEDWVSVNDWYDMIGLPSLEDLEDLGWNVEEGLEFEFNSCIAPSTEPCIVIDYDISPRFDYRNLH